MTIKQMFSGGLSLFNQSSPLALLGGGMSGGCGLLYACQIQVLSCFRFGNEHHWNVKWNGNGPTGFIEESERR